MPCNFMENVCSIAPSNKDRLQSSKSMALKTHLFLGSKRLFQYDLPDFLGVHCLFLVACLERASYRKV